MICVIAYFVLMGILTVYLSYAEKGIFLVALEQDRAMMEPDNKWVLSSSLRKYDVMYNLTIQYTDGKTQEERMVSCSKCVANFFDDNGVFCFDLFSPVIERLRQDALSDKKKQ